MSTEINRATLEDLMKVEGKAELIDGRIVEMSPVGRIPNFAAGEIFASLREHVRSTGTGMAATDGQGYAVDVLSSGRQSFSPDASYYDGPAATRTMRYIEDKPTFAAEVRSENDYGRAAERDIAAKRADYFEAGTLVVWDVDPLNEVIRCFHLADPENPRVFRRGDTADAEPAVPGWRVAVDELFL